MERAGRPWRSPRPLFTHTHCVHSLFLSFRHWWSLGMVVGQRYCLQVVQAAWGARCARQLKGLRGRALALRPYWFWWAPLPPPVLRDLLKSLEIASPGFVALLAIGKPTHGFFVLSRPFHASPALSVQLYCIAPSLPGVLTAESRQTRNLARARETPSPSWPLSK